MTRKAEILVVGGGPAGCIAALGLAKVGHHVRLITAPRRRSAIEGLSERVVRALEANGCRHALGALGPVVPREASWNGTWSAANREWVVAREHFDAALLEDASAAGTAIEHGRVRRLHRLPQRWRIETGSGIFFADYLIEARGRQAPGRRWRGPATTSLGQAWRGLPKGGRTAVTGFRRGWAWFATTGDGCGSLQIMLASDPAVLPKRSGLAAFYAALLTEIDAHAWLADAQPDGAVHARHAETSAAVTPLGEGHIRVGDAALAIDPLAGHGVFEAIATATAAVPVVNTALRRPHDAPLACAFYRERVASAFERFARIGRDFYALEQRWPDAPFWRERSTWPDDRPAHLPATAAVPVISAKPVSEDGFIVQRRTIVTADHPRGIWLVDQVPVADLLELIRCEPTLDDTALARQLDRSPAQIETALAWLRHRGLIPTIPMTKEGA